MHHRSKSQILIYKNFRRNHTSSLCDLELGRDFLDMTLKAQSMEINIDELDFIKIKKCLLCKGTVKKTKRYAIDWGAIFVNHLSTKRLVSRKYNEFKQPFFFPTSLLEYNCFTMLLVSAV